MPSALETLVKILKLEQDTGYQDKAVIGGLKSFVSHWANDAHAQAKKPEHHALVDELSGLANRYADLPSSNERHEAIKYMLGRIMGRIPSPATPSHPPAATSSTSKPPAPPPHTESHQPTQSAQSTRPAAPRSDQSQQNQWQSRRQEQRRPAPRAVHTNKDDADSFGEEHAKQLQEPGAIALGLLPGDKSRLPESASANDSLPTIVDAQSLDIEPALPEVEALTDREPIRTPIPSQTSVAPSPAPTPAITPLPPRRRRLQRDAEREAHILKTIKGSVSTINGIGPKMAEKLEQIEIRTIEDLLFAFPRRYDDYTLMLPLNKLQPGKTMTAVGTVRNAIVIKGKRGVEVLNVTIDDGSGILAASFFGQPYLRTRFEPGTQVVFSGKVDLFNGRVTMNNPEWELLEREALHTRAIVPVYPLTKGLTSHNMRKFTRAALDQWASQLPDFMPESVLDRVNLADLGWAIQQMHFPSSWDMLEHARRRLMFDELILLQLGVLRNRREWQSMPGEPMIVGDDWIEWFESGLPFALTGAQQRAIQAIREDMERPVPMNRLLQGDVGSGKTAVAAAAMTIAVASGFQAAILAPTAILAEQHYRSLSRLINALPGGDGINVKILTSGTSSQERADILWGLGEGSIHIVVGTHALLERDVFFQRLGVSVIDEQHRFGVEQRSRLRGKGMNPHTLIMTATPIPRTLALTMYADLDLAVLDEMPPGRTPIDTRILLAKERERAYSFIDSQIKKGRQAFIIYPLVEASESETLSEVRSAVEEYERLQKQIFPHRGLGLLHGRLSSAEKDEVMSAFSRGELDILVSTSVVEVGIDVPNASVMMIEGANRFGLAQLHQFRGRVGRGEHPSFCLLIPDDGNNNARLEAMESTTDGFKLAQIDWEMRGAGDLLGTRQSGGTSRLGQYMDVKIVEEAQYEARTLYEEDPILGLPEHEGLRERLRQRFGDQWTAEVS